MRRTKKVLLVVPVAATAAVLAGCGSSNNSSAAGDSSSLTPAAGSSTATVTDTVVPPTTTATAASSAPVVSGPGACATSGLTITLGAGDGTAGSTYYPLHLTNKGSASCTITGFPGVSFVAPGNGAQVGAPAQRSGAVGATITLAPGAQATSLVQVADYANFDPSQCAATAVSGFRVYAPGNTAASYVPFPGGNQMACSKDLTATGSSELLVQTAKAGATGM